MSKSISRQGITASNAVRSTLACCRKTREQELASSAIKQANLIVTWNGRLPRATTMAECVGARHNWAR